MHCSRASHSQQKVVFRGDYSKSSESPHMLCRTTYSSTALASILQWTTEKISEQIRIVRFFRLRPSDTAYTRTSPHHQADPTTPFTTSHRYKTITQRHNRTTQRHFEPKSPVIAPRQHIPAKRSASSFTIQCTLYLAEEQRHIIVTSTRTYTPS